MGGMKEWLLYFSVFLYTRGRSRTRVNAAPKRILIVQMAKLGDMVCTTPMFRAVKAHYPDASVTVLGNHINREVLAGNQDVNGYIEWKGIRETIRIVRREKFDFACITSPSAPLLAVLFLAGIPAIGAPRLMNGRSPNDTPAYRMLTRLCFTRSHHMRQYAPREYLRLLEPIDIITDDTTKHLKYSETAEKRIESFLREKQLRRNGRMLFGLAPSAGHKTKEWFPDRFAQVVTQLAQKYPIDVVLIGSVADKKAAEAVRAHLPDSVHVIDTCGLFSIEEAKALIASLDILLSVDTGPVYVAEAFAVPTIDITGPIDENEQPPIGEMHLVVVPPSPREPQLFVLNARSYDKKEVERQLNSITVPMVVEACSTLLNKITRPHS